ncbi:MAG: hypothetical protein M1830_003695 [Pleopsidium flavum]|nr:MAG: hypothetical protein M1830_003695 [Pleopsidium flavum]
MTPPPPPPRFPSHSGPRVWLITSGNSPLGIALARQVLAHGDYVVAGLIPAEFEKDEERFAEFRGFLQDAGQNDSVGGGGKERLRVVGLDVRLMGQCQAAVADAVQVFGRVDILFCCTSEAIIGTVEELAASQRTLTLIREQFETNFFGPVNIIKASVEILPLMQCEFKFSTASHLGTPGLGLYCASGWAIEGFCDSLAYEIAPFNIKMTIVQPNLEISVLTNKITSAPPLPQYSPDNNPAPLSREILGGLLDRLDSNTTFNGSSKPPTFASPEIVSLYPALPPSMKSALLAETLHALTAIGGHENPPARHIVGFEGVASVKEKLKTVSEELEDFVEVSGAVDIEREEE